MTTAVLEQVELTEVQRRLLIALADNECSPERTNEYLGRPVCIRRGHCYEAREVLDAMQIDPSIIETIFGPTLICAYHDLNRIPGVRDYLQKEAE